MNEFNIPDFDIEDQLKQALRREDPSPNFANRVIARAVPAPPARKPMRIWGPAVGAIAAMLVAGIGVEQYREHKAEQTREQAREQVELALQIAATKFNAVQSKAFSKLNREREQ